MGLDMYLTRKIYVGGEHKHNKVKGTVNITIGEKKLKLKATEISEICIRAGYWRKSNHIHKWFVNNVQDGEDDCKEYWVSQDQLKELKDICQKVLDNHDLAVDLLPSQTGFFFGGTDYDEWYFGDLAETIQIIDYCLEHPDDSYYYQASW